MLIDFALLHLYRIFLVRFIKYLLDFCSCQVTELGTVNAEMDEIRPFPGRDKREQVTIIHYD